MESVLSMEDPVNFELCDRGTEDVLHISHEYAKPPPRCFVERRFERKSCMGGSSKPEWTDPRKHLIKTLLTGTSHSDIVKAI